MFETRDISRGEASRTRFRFQLTSLMDLLLIIVFAQFLEFRQASDSTRRETLAALDAQKSELAEQYAEAQIALDRRQREWEQDAQAIGRELDAAVEMARAASRERDRLIDSMRGLLSESTEGFSPRDSSAESQLRVESAERLGRRLAAVEATEMLRFLVGYEELLKRAEIWTLHVSDRGDINVRGGGSDLSFRLEARDQPSRTEEFITQLRAASRSFPQPKGLVVVLASYSPLAVAGNYQPVIDGLPRAMEFLAADADQRTRFESAVIGAVADPQRDLVADPQRDIVVDPQRDIVADPQRDLPRSDNPSGN